MRKGTQMLLPIIVACIASPLVFAQSQDQAPVTPPATDAPSAIHHRASPAKRSVIGQAIAQLTQALDEAAAQKKQAARTGTPTNAGGEVAGTGLPGNGSSDTRQMDQVAVEQVVP
jgi:hypothetical protein